MNKQTEELLKKLGFTAEQISNLKDEAKAKEVDVEEVYNEVHDNLKTAILEDPQNTKEIEQKVRGGFAKSKLANLQRSFSQFLTKEEIAELPQDKNFDEAIVLLKKKVEAKIAAGSNDDDKAKQIADLTKEVDDLSGKVRKYEEEEIPKLKEEANQQVLGVKSAVQFEKMIGSHKTIVKAEIASRVVRDKIEEEYDLKFDGRQWQVFKKGTTQPARKNNQPVKLDELVKEHLTTEKLIVASNAGRVKEEGGDDGDKKDPPKFNLPGLEKAQAALDAAKSGKEA
jgi:hypothetical protein